MATNYTDKQLADRVFYITFGCVGIFAAAVILYIR